MNHVTKYLSDIMQNDPMAESDASSHWKIFLKKDGGFGDIGQGNLIKNTIAMSERFTYHSAYSKLSSYKEVWGEAKQLVRDLSIGLSNTVWYQTMILSTLMDHWKKYNLSPKTFCLIGDGYGFLGSLIYRFFPNAIIFCMDLPKMLLLQATTHIKANPNKKIDVMTPKNLSPGKIYFVPPHEIENIQCDIECAINAWSMQEMKNDSIEKYFHFLRKRGNPSSHFYCINRLTTKLPGGEVTEFYKYPWKTGDKLFIDEKCPYATHFLSLRHAKNAYGEYAKKPMIFGFSIPFINYFDGISIHRLVHLCP